MLIRVFDCDNGRIPFSHSLPPPQNEYMHRLDYQWKRQLKQEQEQASTTKLVNKMLLQNILPLHVADVYLTNRHGGNGRGLYSESYSSVAVMFASIPDYVDFYAESSLRLGGQGFVCLKILNDIIALFDKLLFHDQFGRVEKIKVISSTYMAACGLQPGRRGSDEFRRASGGGGGGDNDDDGDDGDAGSNARTLARFAACMINELENTSFKK